MLKPPNSRSAWEYGGANIADRHLAQEICDQGLESVILGIVLVVGGASLPEILSTSTLGSLVNQGEKRFVLYAFQNLQEYQTKLEQSIYFDTAKLIRPGMSSEILMFTASQDDVVPSKTQENLWDLWGRPERKIYDNGHRFTIAKAYFLQNSKIAEFSKLRLSK